MFQLRNVGRCHAHRIVSSVVAEGRRSLTSAELATALRPFYFVVHPDLFGKHPKERAVNEESLKHLNQHLGRIQHQSQVKPINLQFYTRKNQPTTQTKGSPVHKNIFQLVDVTLQPASVQETVRCLLQSCDLPLDYVNSIKSAPLRQDAFPRKVVWDPTFYTFYGMANPNEEKKVWPSQTLNSWLDKNLTKAKVKQEQIRPIRKEVERLHDKLLCETGIRGVLWDSGWGQTQFRAALRGLLRVYRQNTDLDLKDKHVTFGCTTGVCCHGNILLRSDDIAESWLWVLQTASKHMHLVNKLPAIELHLSTLLNNIQVTRRLHRPPVAELYVQQLRRLAGSVKHALREEPNRLPADLSDVQMTVECMTGPMLVSAAGVMRVPSSSPGFLVVNFIKNNANLAREKQLQSEQVSDLQKSLVSDCCDVLGLRSLRSAENITPEQLIACCQQLLEDSGKLPVSLEGCRLQINNFYSLRSDGEMCIPWNYSSGKFAAR